MVVAADFCICADGGANRLYEVAPGFAQHVSPAEARSLAKPAVSAGDLDSITDEARDFYEGLGTKICDLADDQDSTDLQKCITELESHFTIQQLAEATIIAAGQILCGIECSTSCIAVLTLPNNANPALLRTIRRSGWQTRSYFQCPQHTAQMATLAFGVMGRWEHGTAVTPWQAYNQNSQRF